MKLQTIKYNLERKTIKEYILHLDISSFTLEKVKFWTWSHTAQFVE